MRILVAAVLGAAVLVGSPGFAPVLAHEGHDHADKPGPASANALPRAEAVSDTFELVAVAGHSRAADLSRPLRHQRAGGGRRHRRRDAGRPVARHRSLRRCLSARRALARQARPFRPDLHRDCRRAGGRHSRPHARHHARGRHVRLGRGSIERAGHLRRLAQPACWPPPQSASSSGLSPLLLALEKKRSRTVVAAWFVSGTFTSFAHEGHEHEESCAPPSRRVRNARSACPTGRLRSQARPAHFRHAHRDHRTRHHPPLDRIAGPDHSRSQRQRIRAGFRRRPAVPAAGRIPAARHRASSKATCSPMSRRRCRPSTSPTCASGRANSISRSPSSSAASPAMRRLPQAARCRASQLEDTRLELQGLRDRRAALDKVRARTRSSDRARRRHDRRWLAGRRQMAQPNTVDLPYRRPGQLWIEALSFDAVAGREVRVRPDRGRHAA